jgi:hypothetical protein
MDNDICTNKHADFSAANMGVARKEFFRKRNRGNGDSPDFIINRRLII